MGDRIKVSHKILITQYAVLNTVHKDGLGRVTEIVEQETIQEPYSEMPKVKEMRSTQFDNLK